MTPNLARLSLVIFLALPIGADAETVDLPPLPSRNPLRRRPGHKAGAAPSEQPTMPWTEAEITDAASEVQGALTGDPLDYEFLPPIKEGLCDTPAPVLAACRGPRPESRDQSAGDAQLPDGRCFGNGCGYRPAGSQGGVREPVVKIQNSSSYVCRNRYGGAGTPLSEHALANAFDVSEFVLANGVRISVLGSLAARRVNPASQTRER